MQGRLMGKRFQAEFFLESGHTETHSCNYLLATDLEMETVPGYKATSWAAGYGDYAMKPDLATLRRMPWLAGHRAGARRRARPPRPRRGAAFAARHAEAPDRPAARDGLRAMMASELEFFLFSNTYADLHAAGYRGLTPISPYNEDYHIFQTTKEEEVMRAIRTGLNAAGIPVECSKGEASAGQEEINVRYADALDSADAHAIVKNGVKEIAWSKGRALTFMAKYDSRAAGSSSHVHQSLRTLDGTARLLRRRRAARHVAADAALGGGAAGARRRDHLFPRALRQQLQALHGRDLRADQGDLVDRQPHRRLPAGRRGHPSVRIECRVGGADLNPYLAYAALIAAGIDGIERELELEPEFRGDAYAAARVREIPKTLRDATEALRRSKMLRAALGDDVVDHYVHAARWEQARMRPPVTDWEVARGFERA